MSTRPVTSASDWRPSIDGAGVGALGLIVANIAVVWLVFAFDVTPFQLVFVFWCECLWIGLFNALKLLAAGMFGNPFANRFADVSSGAAVFSALLIIAVASMPFFAMLGAVLLAILFANDWLALSAAADAPLAQIGVVIGASGALAAGHALSFVVNFLLLGEFRAATVRMLVMQPFRRCGALLLAVAVSLTAAALTPALATTAVFGALVLVVKVVLDLRLHVAERRRFARTP